MQAVFSGVANAVITADHLDAPVSYEGLAAAGSGLGSAGFVVYDDTACTVLVSSILRSYPEEFALHLEGRGSVDPRPIAVPKLVDLADGVATYDERHPRKQPDWTYAEA